MNKKLSEIIKQDKKVAVAVDGGKTSTKLLSLCCEILGHKNVLGIAVLTQNEVGATIKDLQSKYPLIIKKIDYSKVNLNFSEKLFTIIMQVVMQEANKNGFATIYTGLTADNENFKKQEILNNLQIFSPFAEAGIEFKNFI